MCNVYQVQLKAEEVPWECSIIPLFRLLWLLCAVAGESEYLGSGWCLKLEAR